MADHLVSGDKKLLVKGDCDDDAGEYQQTFYLCIVPVHLRAIRCQEGLNRPDSGRSKSRNNFPQKCLLSSQGKNGIALFKLKGKAYINVGCIRYRPYEYQFNMYSPYDNQLPGTNRENSKTQTD